MIGKINSKSEGCTLNLCTYIVINLNLKISKNAYPPNEKNENENIFLQSNVFLIFKNVYPYVIIFWKIFHVLQQDFSLTFFPISLPLIKS